jgi:hypothetical protein
MDNEVLRAAARNAQRSIDNFEGENPSAKSNNMRIPVKFAFNISATATADATTPIAISSALLANNSELKNYGFATEAIAVDGPVIDGKVTMTPTDPKLTISHLQGLLKKFNFVVERIEYSSNNPKSFDKDLVVGPAHPFQSESERRISLKKYFSTNQNQGSKIVAYLPEYNDVFTMGPLSVAILNVPKSSDAEITLEGYWEVSQ